MFVTKSISTLELLEERIQTLEFAFYMFNTVQNFDLQTQITIELGHLYNAKMQIIKSIQYEKYINKEFKNIKTYPSKINSERAETQPHDRPRYLPKLWEQYNSRQ